MNKVDAQRVTVRMNTGGQVVVLQPVDSCLRNGMYVIVEKAAARLHGWCRGSSRRYWISSIARGIAIVRGERRCEARHCSQSPEKTKSHLMGWLLRLKIPALRPGLEEGVAHQHVNKYMF